MSNFAYVSSYFQTKALARERDYVISSKLQCQDLNPDHFTNLTFYILKNYPIRANAFFTGPSILRYFLRLNHCAKIKFSFNDPQETADLVTFTEEIHNGKLHFLCSEFS